MNQLPREYFARLIKDEGAKILDCQSLTALSNQVLKYDVIKSDGSAQSFVQKTFTPDRLYPRKLDREISVNEAMREIGISVPPILDYSSSENWILMGFVPGEHENSIEYLKLLVETASSAHTRYQYSKTFKKLADEGIIVLRDYRRRMEEIDSCRKTFRRLNLPPDYSRNISNIVRESEEYAKTFVFHDFAPENTKMTKDGLTVFDFERASLGLPTEDIACLSLHFSDKMEDAPSLILDCYVDSQKRAESRKSLPENIYYTLDKRQMKRLLELSMLEKSLEISEFFLKDIINGDELKRIIRDKYLGVCRILNRELDLV